MVGRFVEHLRCTLVEIDYVRRQGGFKEPFQGYDKEMARRQAEPISGSETS
jgi:hypothetical protein